jgi:hypothetical protein
VRDVWYNLDSCRDLLIGVATESIFRGLYIDFENAEVARPLFILKPPNENI